MNATEIRRRFLSFFEQRGHKVLPSSALIPERDPTLFFVNAGMVQFKNIFTGVEAPKQPRATTSQKCLRVSGKHNDLEIVGQTPRHHTFFEMLGNFSFGDYFKEQAIEHAWTLLTSSEEAGGFALDPSRLWVTVYQDDDEAYDIWTQKMGVPAERVQRLGEKDNFWSMGDTGPCGPCSEIHWDHGPEHGDDENGPAGETDRYVEIWNLVFMQYERHEDGSQTDLPSPSIDTGMGLERLAAIKQGVYWNYDTDLFQGVIKAASELAGKPYTGSTSADDMAMRVIADHARSATFLVADGVMPTNEGRGYVLRRIMRRAIRYGVKLGLEEPFLWRAAQQIIQDMAPAYPALKERETFILEVIRGEEERFALTLAKGLELLEKAMEECGGTLDGEVVFTLFDTYGFPKDLTALIAGERDIAIDLEGYEQAMEAQKARSRAGAKGSGDIALSGLEADLAAELSETTFLGYDTDEGESTVLALIQEGERVRSIQSGKASIVTAATPFYAESGGQVGDSGRIQWEGGSFRVLDTRKAPGGLHMHVGELESGNLAQGDTVTLFVDGSRRDRTRLNHSATHLLHAALREVLGDHVQQKGSLVDDARLRFDFSHHKSVSSEELQAIEDRVYQQVLANTPVNTALKDLEQAKADGAMALFGEKYDDLVRVVSMGTPGFSTELCGGTHVSATGDIGLFKITSESGVAAGVRRIEAVTGAGAMAWVRARDAAATAAASSLRASVDQLPEAIERLQADRKRLEKELSELRTKLARQAAGDLSSQAREIDGIKVLAAELPADVDTLRKEADRLRDKLGTALVVLATRQGGVKIIAAATKDVAGKRVHAGNIVREVAKAVGGGGGGRPDMAQAGGKDPEKLPEALELVYTLVKG
ncbi:MAG: alanine--tRNA ligase [Myxococcota bacterium]|nr:alanine--tRNA ligase [Myxococcota bacterium]